MRHTLMILVPLFLITSCKQEVPVSNTKKVSTEVPSSLVSGVNTVPEEIKENTEENKSASASQEEAKNIETSHQETETSKKEKKTTKTETKNTTSPIKIEVSSSSEGIKVTNTPSAPIRKESYPKVAPQLTFKEMEWDFGEITEGDIVEKKFEFTNTGNGVLQITGTSATCGCTRPSFPFIDIMPGESNVIGVRFNSVGKEGDQNPEVTVEANTIPKLTVLKLFGTVKVKPKVAKVDSTISQKDSSKVGN